MLLLVLDCTCAGPKPEVVTPGPATVREVTTRFHGQADTPLAPAAAFDVQGRCPVLTRLTYTTDNGGARVLLEGEHLDRVVRVAGALPDGTLVDMSATPADGTLEVPILAPSVEVWLGVRTPTGAAACRGPGYSFSVVDHHLVP